MAEPVALTDSGIPEAIATAAERGHQVAVAYIDDDGYPSVSFRGTTQVIGPDRLAIWARKRDAGLAAAIAVRPQVGLVYYGPGGGARGSRRPWPPGRSRRRCGTTRG